VGRRPDEEGRPAERNYPACFGSALVRGHEEGSILAPISKPLHLLGLGMSVSTPKEGITADVMFVPSFDASMHFRTIR